MKNKIITICVIMAALLSFMSFAAVLTQMNSKADEPEEDVSEIIVRDDVGCITGGFLTIRYVEGMTWREWINSEYNDVGFTLQEGSGLIIYDNQYVLEERDSLYFYVDHLIDKNRDYHIF